jgi:hypothetical protein
MLKLLNSFTINLARPYVKLTFDIIFNQSEIALKIKRSQGLEISPFSYVRQGVICIIGVWSLAYLATGRITASPSLVFSIIIGIYYLFNILLLTVILWALRVINKPISVILGTYSYIVGAFAPIAITSIEIIRFYYMHFGNKYQEIQIEKIVIFIISIIGITYLYNFMRIIHKIKLLRYIIAIVIYSLCVNEVIDNIFIKLIDVMKYNSLM